MMALLIVLLLVGVILRWDNIKQKAGIWFRADEIMEERRSSMPDSTAVQPAGIEPADSTAQAEQAPLPEYR